MYKPSLFSLLGYIEAANDRAHCCIERCVNIFCTRCSSIFRSRIMWTVHVPIYHISLHITWSTCWFFGHFRQIDLQNLLACCSGLHATRAPQRSRLAGLVLIIVVGVDILDRTNLRTIASSSRICRVWGHANLHKRTGNLRATQDAGRPTDSCVSATQYAMNVLWIRVKPCFFASHVVNSLLRLCMLIRTGRLRILFGRRIGFAWDRRMMHAGGVNICFLNVAKFRSGLLHLFYPNVKFIWTRPM